MTTVSRDLDLQALITDTEAEILRVVGERAVPSTAGVYEMVRYHLGLDHDGAPSGKRIRPLLGLLAYTSIAGDHAAALPGAAAVELGHNFSLVHDDIEDGDRERRHRPTLWAVHGVPQAINAGDMLFSLSRIALHRLSELGFSDAKVLRLMRLYDETCVALCEGQYIDIATSESDDADVGRALLRHDRPQDRGADRRLDRGRRAAGDRRRRDRPALPGVRLGAGDRVPAQRRPPGHLGRRAGDRQGAVRHRPPQEDAAGDLRVRARRPRGPRAAGRGCTATATSRTATSRRSSRSSSGPAPATSPATRPAATATRRSPSWTPRA